jgi:3-oxoacyl-[acyl-carrier protein] reductase
MATAVTAIVTGASGEIGRGIAERLAADGYSVVVHYSRNFSKADETARKINAQGGRAMTLAADISKQDDVKKLFKDARTAFGDLTAVVNCAAVIPLSTIQKGDIESFDNTVATNLRGSFLLMSEAANHVVDGGRIIVFSSSVIAKGFPTYGAYIASKAGVEGLMHVLANELGPRGITVNAVAPGPVATALFLNGKSDEEIANFAKMAPLERIGEIADVVGLVSFLLGREGGWVNGQVIRVNGGYA